MNYDSGLWRDLGEQKSQIVRSERHTAGRWAKSRACNMNKHSASPTADTRPGVVVDFDNEIIEAIGAAETVSWFTG
jgi:hypothetical protein